VASLAGLHDLPEVGVPKLVGDFTARKTWRVVTSAS
jgi:hypothetical protein